jgi:hypothetical protein
MIIAAALCPAPPLLARELTGQAEVLPELRGACAAAVSSLLAVGADEIVIVGPGELTATWSREDYLNLRAYAPGVAPRPDPEHATERGTGRPELPLALGIGARLLDESGYDGPRGMWSITGTASPAECARLGKDLAAPVERVALLVMGDGSARRSVSAPGYLDERAGPFDAEVERAVREGDIPALAALDPDLAHDLMVSGRSAWQVLAAALAAALADGELRPDILYCDAPFGVGYLVATLSPRS